jgi:hypothetical protein
MKTNRIRSKNNSRNIPPKEQKQDNKRHFSDARPNKPATVTLILKDPKSSRVWERVEIPGPFYRQIESAARQLGISVPRFFEDAIRAIVEKGGVR